MGKQSGVVLNAHIFLAAEAAAYHGRRHPDLFGRKAEGVGTFPLGLIYALIPAYYVYAAVLGEGYGAFRLHKGMLCEGQTVMVGDGIPAFRY